MLLKREAKGSTHLCGKSFHSLCVPFIHMAVEQSSMPVMLSAWDSIQKQAAEISLFRPTEVQEKCV